MANPTQAVPSAPGVRPRARRSRPRALLAAARPRQWTKNVLLLAAPAAAGKLTTTHVALEVAGAIVAFCLVSSGTYLVNDARDAEADRRHPSKRYRPIAAGDLPIPLALVFAATFFICGIALAAAIRWQLVVAIAAYIVLTLSYTLWLKDIAVVDIVAVACGFVVRAVAGGAATGVPLSRWFLIVASFGSLFMVAGKRHGEHLDLGPDETPARVTLASYTVQYLRYVWMFASAVATTAYCLWAFEQARIHGANTLYELTVLPFILFILRYALMVEQGYGGTPEDIVLGDRPLKVFSLIWVVLFGSAIYLGH